MPCARQFLLQGFCASAAAAVMQRQAGAPRSEGLGGGAADAAGRACDEHRLTLEVHALLTAA